jgi:hypothetical protein
MYKLPKKLSPGGGILGRVRQFVDATAARGKEDMKATVRAKRADNFAAGVGRVPRRAARAARKQRGARNAIYNWATGKILARKSS